MHTYWLCTISLGRPSRSVPRPALLAQLQDEASKVASSSLQNAQLAKHTVAFGVYNGIGYGPI